MKLSENQLILNKATNKQEKIISLTEDTVSIVSSKGDIAEISLDEFSKSYEILDEAKKGRKKKVKEEEEDESPNSEPEKDEEELTEGEDTDKGPEDAIAFATKRLNKRKSEGKNIDETNVRNVLKNAFEIHKETYQKSAEDALIKKFVKSDVKEETEDDEDETKEKVSETVKKIKEKYGKRKEETEDDEDEEMNDEPIEEENEDEEEDVDLNEDLSALFNGTSLSEEFHTKTKTIFESAVKRHASILSEAKVKKLKEAHERDLENVVETMETAIDDYLQVVVENWEKKNEVAIKRNFRTQVAESFMSGLKQLFEEHNIDIPEEKIDLLDEQVEENEKLKQELSEALDTIVSIKRTLNEEVSKRIFLEETEDMTDTDRDKLRSLSENLSFTNSATFKKQLHTLRESYFENNTSNKDTGLERLTEAFGKDAEEVVKKNPRIDSWLSKVGRVTGS